MSEVGEESAPLGALCPAVLCGNSPECAALAALSLCLEDHFFRRTLLLPPVYEKNIIIKVELVLVALAFHAVSSLGQHLHVQQAATGN